MRADALAQYLAWKRWKSWFLLRGNAKEDIEYAEAMKRAAKKFGGKIVEERTIIFDPGNRNSETGHQQIQTQIPMRTQNPPPHDIVVVADTQDTFGEYLMWRTSLPKPIAGTQGLVSVAWGPLYEEYGGIQLQKRFRAKIKRPMTERDYMAWLAVRVFGEAVTRSGKADIAGWRTYILSPQFGVAGFKGQAMSFRPWDRQLRQPILLTGPRSLVSTSPQEGFLHPKYLTDTLGVDAPETTCKLPG
jgi:ABC transporter substrate binding protein (PQQ-dependent alcohol dehydrogenase system)